MRDRQSSCLRNVKCWRSKKRQFESYRWHGFKRERDHRLLLLHFHSVKNFQATLTTAVKSERCGSFSFKNARLLLDDTYICRAILAEGENSHEDRPLINVQEHMRNAIYLVLPISLKDKFRRWLASRAIKLETIFVKNEDANEDEDASWKIVYELRMITACLIWNHKARP